MKEIGRSAVLHFLSGFHLDFCFICAELYQVNIYKLLCSVYANVDTFRFDFKVGYTNIILKGIYVYYFLMNIKDVV